MTRGLENALGLPSLSEALAENNIEVETPRDPSDTGVNVFDHDTAVVALPDDTTLPLPDFIGTNEHSKAMEVIYDEALKLGRETADMGFQSDQPRIPSFMQAANALLKTAIEAATKKHDGQLATVKADIEKRRLAILERQEAGTGVGSTTTKTEGVFVADRNEIIAQALAAKKASQEDQ